MVQLTANFITVPEVIADMGLETTNELDWKVGKLMQQFWEHHTGQPPLKDNRKKTNGTGTHCFALYPEAWRAKIQGFVRMVKFEESRQPGLFDNLLGDRK